LRNALCLALGQLDLNGLQPNKFTPTSNALKGLVNLTERRKYELKNPLSPFLKLRKLLVHLNNDASSQDIHSLRTHARRVEMVIAALRLGHKNRFRKLLKTVKPLRKVAGAARDMDVLTSTVFALSQNHSDDSLVRLATHLGQLRKKSAGELLDLVAAKHKNARRILKRYSQLLRKRFQKEQANAIFTSAAVTLAAKLSRWPEFSENNIHAFRIKVKELRYMLQLSPNTDGTYLDTLRHIKDKIGDWHDWHKLAEIAADTLDPEMDRKLLMRIEKTGNRKLLLALSAANSMRQQSGSSVSIHRVIRRGGPEAIRA